MPNHIQNRLRLLGADEEILKVLSAIGGKYDDGTLMRIDFNKIIPAPDGINVEMHSGIETAIKNTMHVPLHKNELISGLERMNRAQAKSPTEFTDEEFEKFIQGLRNYKAHGFINWYDWNTANWGTKWNAYDQNDARNIDREIYFQTAWAAPLKVIVKLSELFPKVTFQLDYADEDSGSNVGKYDLLAGEIIEEDKPENQSNEAYEIYFDLHPDSRNDYEMVDGKYSYKEEA